MITDSGQSLGQPGAFAIEFPGWQISVNQGDLGISTAYWRSPDGRSRRYIVACSAAKVLDRLRTIKHPSDEETR
jgi:hypothetical protein